MSDGEATEYASMRSRIDPLGGLAVNLLRSLLTSSGIKFHDVVYRVKTQESALKKVSGRSERYSGIAELTDLLGVRITTYFPDEVDAVASLVEREFSVDLQNSIDKRTVLDPDRFGYLSMHYIVSLNEARGQLIEYRDFNGLRFEIQIRSVLQHAWAEIEHDLGYKAGLAVPREVRRRFARLAGLLELADVEFCSIRDDLNAYVKRISEEIRSSPEAVGIDAESYVEYVLNDALVNKLDVELCRIVGARLLAIPREMAAFWASAVVDLGYANIAELAQELRDNEQLVIEFAKEWRLKDRELKLIPELISGVSVIYLLYTVLTHKSDSDVAAWFHARGLGKNEEFLRTVRAAMQAAQKKVERKPRS